MGSETIIEGTIEYLSLQAFGLAWMIYMFTGMVWYAPSVFGDRCSKLAFGNKTPPKPDDRAIAATTLGGAMGVFFFTCILSATRCESAVEGALWGLAFGFFFSSGMNVSHPFFENRPFSLFAIHCGCHALSLALSGLVLGQFCVHQGK